MSNEELKDFKGFDIELEYEKIIDHYSQVAKQIVVEYSPKRTGNYASGWVSTKTKRAKGYEVIVWNEKAPQLTHLLENGHQIVNKKGGIGWASGDHHIQNAYDYVASDYFHAMENVDIIFK